MFRVKALLNFRNGVCLQQQHTPVGVNPRSLVSASAALARFHVPKHYIKFKAIRSSGPGGQNVNKVSTCVEARFDVKAAPFLPKDAKERLLEQEANRINKNGELVIIAQEERTQARNKAIVQEKLDHIVSQALIEPKVRKQWSGLGEKTKLKRKDMKQHRKNTKSNRKVQKTDW